MMRSLSFRITVITISAILIAILSVFVVSYLTIQSENTRVSVEMMNLMARDLQKSLEKYLENIEDSVEMAANIATDSLDSAILVENGAAGTYATEHPQTARQAEQLDKYLAEYTERVQESFASIASRTLGIEAYYYCITPEISSDQHGFFYSKMGKTGFVEQPPLDARELDPEDIGQNTWYFTPIERGRPSWVGPYTAFILEEMWTCSYVMPVYKAGSLIGVIGMDIPYRTLISQIQSIRIYDTGFACLTDEEGRIIYHPQLSIGSKPDLSDLSIDDDILKQESNGDQLIQYHMGREERMMAFTTLSSGMKLVITAPTSKIYASWLRLASFFLLITAAIITAAVLIIILVMRYITRPLKKLTIASSRLAAADYDVELDYNGKDEIGELTLSFSKMRDQLKHYIENLNRRIRTDALTDLPNMRYFFRIAEETRCNMRENGEEPLILFFNLVGMKQYNRQYGFDEGDNLLCEIGDILARHYGSQNLCRYGQDHFAVLTASDHPEEELKAIFLECQNANGGKSLPVKVGIYPDSIEDVSISVACDRAKHACRQYSDYISHVSYFNSVMLKQTEDIRYIINHLDQALQEHWIKAYYQPIIRAGSGLICDEEALCRWIDPERGMLSPGLFIPILESAGLIYKLDLYILDQILDTMLQRRQEGVPVVPCSLNLSRQDFDACDIVAEICRRVDHAGIAHEMVTIEITESIVGKDFTFMKSQILRFQELGFPVWMDDFGSGYSSLDVLQDIHFDLLKFDMRFMHRFHEGNESRIILTELIHMASKLGIETVCEGVETAQQVDFLKENGCTKLQGFYFSQAVPYEEILRRIREKDGCEYE